MDSLDQIKSRIEAAVPGARLQLVPNDSPANQPSLLIDHEHAVAVARFLRDDPQLRFDYASNVTGVDWLDTVLKEKVKCCRKKRIRVFVPLRFSARSPSFRNPTAYPLQFKPNWLN